LHPIINKIAIEIDNCTGDKLNNHLTLHCFLKTKSKNKPMKLKLSTTLVLLCLLTQGIYAQNNASKPNILFILVDDLKPNLGIYGDTTAQSPNIDQLGREGMVFEQAYCNQAVCGPSRYNIMLGSRSTSTGLYR